MSTYKDFTSGVWCLFRGFTFLIGHPRLWFWAIIPTAINLIILAVMLSAFIHYHSDIYAWLSAHLGHLDIKNPDTWYLHIVSAIFWILNFLFQLLLVLLSLILLLVIAYALGLIVAGPFNDALSERVEILITGLLPPDFSLARFLKELIRTIRLESIKACILLAIPIVLFVFNFIPVVGGPLYIVLTLVFGAWSLGFAYSDIPMGRRVIPLKTRLSFARANKWALVGLGLGFVIPFFSLVCVAPMVVGGTLLYIERKITYQEPVK